MKKLLGLVVLCLLLNGNAFAKKIYDANEDGILMKECVFSWSKCYRMATEHCAQYKKFWVHVWNHHELARDERKGGDEGGDVSLPHPVVYEERVAVGFAELDGTL